MPASKDDTNPSGYANYTNAVELMAAILSRMKTPATCNQMCDTLRTETGLTWSQRFKPRYGTFMKFIKKHSEVFVVEGTKVSLHPDYVPDASDLSFVSATQNDTSDTQVNTS